MRIAINGFGRIGRTVFRILENRPGVEVVAINDVVDRGCLAYLLRYDTVMGPFAGEVKLDGDVLATPHQTVKMTDVRSPEAAPWKELGVDFVVESTGVFRQRAQIAGHITAGARKVVLTVPAKDEIDAMIVLGVNEHDLKPEHQIVSNASCTTNCLAPVAKVLQESFGIERGWVTTVHAYTNGQKLVDVPASDWRRGRAAAENIIPTTTGAARAVGKVLPALEGKLDGIAMRVPTPTGSIVDLAAVLGREASASEINDAMRAAAATDGMKGILRYTEDPLVSSDIIGDPHSSIFDSQFTKVIGGNFAKILSWYDNEWGYSSRVCDLLGLLDKV